MVSLSFLFTVLLVGAVGVAGLACVAALVLLLVRSARVRSA